jgi:hypothetical protein
MPHPNSEGVDVHFQLYQIDLTVHCSELQVILVYTGAVLMYDVSKQSMSIAFLNRINPDLISISPNNRKCCLAQAPATA